MPAIDRQTHVIDRRKSLCRRADLETLAGVSTTQANAMSFVVGIPESSYITAIVDEHYRMPPGCGRRSVARRSTPCHVAVPGRPHGRTRRGENARPRDRRGGRRKDYLGSTSTHRLRHSTAPRPRGGRQDHRGRDRVVSHGRADGGNARPGGRVEAGFEDPNACPPQTGNENVQTGTRSASAAPAAPAGSAARPDATDQTAGGRNGCARRLVVPTFSLSGPALDAGERLEPPGP
jgi:hypothetical protein